MEITNPSVDIPGRENCGIVVHTLGEKTFVNETGNDVRIFEVVVVVRTENVGRDSRSEVASELFVVGADDVSQT